MILPSRNNPSNDSDFQFWFDNPGQRLLRELNDPDFLDRYAEWFSSQGGGPGSDSGNNGQAP